MGVLDFFNFPDVDYRTTAPRRAVGLLNRDPTETPLAHLRNLSAGVGAGAVGLGLLSQQPSQAEVEQYLTERGLLQ